MAIYYIATTGDDTTGDGSEGNPWLSFSKAQTTAASGDTIRITGNYTHTLSATFFSNTKTFVFEGVRDAYGRIQAVLDGQAGSAVTWTTQFNAYGHTFRYIKFENYVTATVDGGFIKCNISLIPRFEKCVFTKISVGSVNSTPGYRGGFFAGPTNSLTAVGVVIDRCYFYDIGRTTGLSDGCFFSTRIADTSDVTFTNNVVVFSDPVTYGTANLIVSQISSFTTGSSNTGTFVIKNNIFKSHYGSSSAFIATTGQTFNGLDFTHNALDNFDTPNIAGTANVANNITTTVTLVSEATGILNPRPDANEDLKNSGILV